MVLLLLAYRNFFAVRSRHERGERVDDRLCQDSPGAWRRNDRSPHPVASGQSRRRLPDRSRQFDIVVQTADGRGAAAQWHLTQERIDSLKKKQLE